MTEQPGTTTPASVAHPPNSRPPTGGAFSCPDPTPSGTGSSSLDGSESSVVADLCIGHAQRRIHRSWQPEREQILLALASSDDDALYKRAVKMGQCCASPLVVVRSGGGVGLIPVRCRDRLCPLCAHRRAKEAARRYGEAVARMDATRHLVLTAAAIDAPLAEQLADLRRAMRRLRASLSWRHRVRGGVYSIEITRNKKTGRWHPHCHLIVDGEFYPQAQLVKDWQAALASSGCWASVHREQPPVVHASAVHARHQLAKYIAKYVSKPADISSWPRDSICEYAVALRGVRVLHTFGNLHGVKLSGDEPNSVAGVSSVLIGMSELDWRAMQGYPAAIAAVALLRQAVTAAALWFGARVDAPMQAWAAQVESIDEELIAQINALKRQVAAGPPGTDTRSIAQRRRAEIERKLKEQPMLYQVCNR